MIQIERGKRSLKRAEHLLSKMFVQAHQKRLSFLCLTHQKPLPLIRYPCELAVNLSHAKRTFLESHVGKSTRIKKPG